MADVLSAVPFSAECSTTVSIELDYIFACNNDNLAKSLNDTKNYMSAYVFAYVLVDSLGKLKIVLTDRGLRGEYYGGSTISR